MKRTISLLLVFLLCLSVCACGNNNNNAYEVSKKTYESIKSAHGILQQYNEDLYNAWKIGKYHKQDILDNGIEYIQSNLSLTRDELIIGIAYAVTTTVVEEDWDEVTEETKTEMLQMINETEHDIFEMFKNDLDLWNILIVMGAYVVNGEIKESETYLDMAKEQMKELSQNYSDYAHYSSLVDFYNQTKTFYDFCNTLRDNTTISVDEVIDTIDDYRDNNQIYINELDYIFEE